MAKKSVLETQLEQLERLRTKGTITDAEYQARRAALLSSTSPDVVRVKEGGSGILGIFKWGFFGCFGMIAAVVVLIVIIAVAVSAGGGDDEGEPGEVGTNRGDVHVAFAANASGVIAPDGNGDRKTKVTILQSADGIQSTNQFAKPAAGKKWWGVEVVIENVGSKEITAVSWKLRDTNDGEHDLAFVVTGAPGEALNPVYNLTPGGKTQGWLYFEIPVGSAPKWLRADPNIFLKNDLYFDVQ